MKFIVDAQLPISLSKFLVSNGFDSIHTLELPHKNKTKDSRVIEISMLESRVVITKDFDFLESYILKSEPLKLIIVRTGNIVNKELLSIFRENLTLIIEMITRSNLVEVGLTEIAEHD